MLKELFTAVLENYPSARMHEPFAGHPLGDVVRKQIPNAIASGVDLPESYIIKGSIGQGSWAALPWVAILDQRVTTTTQDGVDLFYTLSADGNSLYFTFNQGCSELLKGKSKQETERILSENASTIRDKLNIPKRLYAGEINTGNRYYDAGCIAFMHYTKGNIPDDDVLFAHICSFCAIYGRYYSKIFVADKKPELLSEQEKTKFVRSGRDAELKKANPEAFREIYYTLKRNTEAQHGSEEGRQPHRHGYLSCFGRQVSAQNDNGSSGRSKLVKAGRRFSLCVL